ncbi:MAG TPA: hypothetical protein VLT16_00430 [Candidatus Limnocylindrales bacterium]|nr:hypothetical protein [Candidatus Limnocylindrales bacterium]
MKKIAYTLLAVAFLASLSVAKAPKATKAKAEKISGWVSDEKCGAKGANGEHADCTKKCEEAGKKLVVVNDKDHSVINVANQDALKGHEGHHVRVTGTLANGELNVTKVVMLKQPKAGAQKGEHKSGM